MGQMTNTPEMAEPMKLIKVSLQCYDRLKKFGFAGESINTALQRVLDLAEKREKK
jgi:hypothetical protein